MASTTFVDNVITAANRIVAAWLNDTNTVVYDLFGDASTISSSRTTIIFGSGATTGITIGTGASSVVAFAGSLEASGTTGSVTMAGGLYVAKKLNLAGAATLAGALIGDATTDSTSITTGAFQTDGGLGVAKALWVGGLANIAGAVTLQSTLAVTGNSTLTGTLALGTSGMTVTGSATAWGFGVTPSAWNSGKALEVGVVGNGLWNNGAAAQYVTSNYYNNSGEKFAGTGYASYYSQVAGVHEWKTSSASGTAGNTATMNQLMTLSAVGTLTLTADAKIAGGAYLGTSTSADALFYNGSNGSGTVTHYIGNQAITTSSDVRLKKDIVDSTRNATEIINALRIVDHGWDDPSDKCENNKDSRGVWTGLIAQEAVAYIPWLVNKPTTDVAEDGTPRYWHMDYGYAVPLLMKAIQELSAEFNAYKDAHP